MAIGDAQAVLLAAKKCFKLNNNLPQELELHFALDHGLKKIEFSDNKDSFERDGLDASSYIFLVGLCGKNS